MKKKIIDMEKAGEDLEVVLQRMFDDEPRHKIVISREGNGWFTLFWGDNERTIYTSEIEYLVDGASIVPREKDERYREYEKRTE